MSTFRLSRLLRRSFSLWGLIVVAWVVVTGLAQVQAQGLSVLHGFSSSIVNATDGNGPVSALVRDASGNFYGTTTCGGSAGHGTVYKVAADGTITILHSFGAAAATYGGGTTADGTMPTGNLILASDGNLYGTTHDGGAAYGTVYRISTTGVFSVIYIFAAQNSIGNPATQSSTGVYPESGVIQGLDGNLYGTTSYGGDYGTGAVFRLGLNGNGYTVLHSFAPTVNGTYVATNDAAYPYLGLVQDAQGNLYGATTRGGSADAGAIYEITAGLQYAVLYNFPAPTTTFNYLLGAGFSLSGTGNYSPVSALAIGPDGNLYGIASNCIFGPGALYKVTPQGDFSIVHAFGDGTVAGDGAVGTVVTGVAAATAIPPVVNPLVLGSDHNFYGVTPLGGAGKTGVIFQLTLAGHVSILHGFGDGSVTHDGAYPVSVNLSPDGNFYGATQGGGAAGAGTVFTINSSLPLITSPLQVTAVLGASFTYHITATQGPDTFTVSGLPADYHFDGASTITGSPTLAGTFTVTLTATNGAGSNTAPLVITAMGVPVISSLLNVEGTTSGVPYQIQATQNPTTFFAAGLPPGVTVEPLNGTFFGAPTATGTYHVTVYATNAAGTGSALVTVNILSAAPSLSQEYTQIHSFNDGSVAGEGTFPGAMTKGNDGTFYGVTAQGGVGGGGTVFNLMPSGVSRVVASFNGTNGSAPQAVMQTTDGTLYGTTQAGGSANLGVIFKITPDGTLTVLHNFGDGTNDGANPQAGLVLASDGNFYGTTQYGGSAGSGTVYQMTPAGVVTILHSFGDNSVTNDGAQPVAALTPAPGLGFGGATLALVGTTLRGGAQDAGTIFAVGNNGHVLIFHSFGDPSVPNDGQLPHGALLAQLPGVVAQPTFYGTTTVGGANHEGTVFCFQLAGSVMTILHSFGDATVAGDGANPLSSLVVVPPSSSSGVTILSGIGTSPTLCGTTQNGGANSAGTVFTCSFNALTTAPSNPVTTILHSFGDATVTNDGKTPLGGGVVIGADGNVYGTTMTGGNTYGTAFALQTNQSSVTTLLTTLGWQCSGTLPTGVNFDSGTGTLTGAPSNAAAFGTYSVTISNTGDSSSTKTYTLTLNQTFAAWANQHAVSSVVTSGSTAGPADGVPMELKYLVDAGNPGQPMTMADHAAMPTMMEDDTSVPGVPYLALKWRQNPGLTGMDVGLEFSNDMVNWSPVTNPLKKQIGTDSVTADPIMEMGAPMDGSPQQFLRLKVTPQ